MSSGLFARSPDLRRLIDQGFELEHRAGHLVVSNIPYVISGGAVARGSLVADLNLDGGDQTRKPKSHVVMWIGAHPCDRSGTPLKALVNDTQRKAVAPDLVIDLTFSSRPDPADADYFELVTRYVDMIEGPAQAIDPSATARTHAVPQPAEADSPFVYIDTASSRAGIAALGERFASMRIGIVGLGGTGSYILDMVAKVGVREIHLFDGDVFGQHNAFRAPGAAAIDELGQGKVEHWTAVYSKMKRDVVPHATFLDRSNADQLAGLDFVFVSMDPGPGKRAVIEQLRSQGTAFIDVGMGVAEEDGKVAGILRVTLSTPERPADIPLAEDPAGDYDQNVQIAELNALSAALAVIAWKKRSGFYRDMRGEAETNYQVDTNDLINSSAA
jgi:hypothetical protein